MLTLCAPRCGGTGLSCNMRFLGSSTRVHISICSAVSAGITVPAVRRESGSANVLLGAGDPGFMQYVVSWVNPSPCPRRHLDPFIRFGTARGTS